MTYHSNDKASIELLDQWGHGKGPRGDWTARPATLIADDGDGHYDAWAYTGDKREAAMIIAGFFKAGCDVQLIVLEDTRVFPVDRHDWSEGVETVESADAGAPLQYHYNPAAHPGGLLMT